MPSILLYNISDDPKVLDKTLSGGVSYSGDFRDSIDLHDPVFTVEDTVGAEYNYCSITIEHEAPDPGITRYYFVRVENVRTGLSLLHCRLDPLMTFNAAIKAAKVCCIRSAVMAKQTPYIVDPRAPVEQRKRIAGQPDINTSSIAAYSSSMILLTVG